MQTRIISLLSIFLLFSLSYCDKGEEEKDPLFKEDFAFSMPEAVSFSAEKELSGIEIYAYLRHFVKLAESGVEAVRAINTTLYRQDITETGDFTVSGADGRQKNCKLQHSASYDGKNYDYLLTVHDGSFPALYFYWNESPYQAFAIVKPSVLNFDNDKHPEAKAKIFYSETSNEYAQELTVSLDGLSQSAVDIPDKVKLFAGKTGDIIYFVGNANLPEITLINDNHADGYQWAFVGKAQQADNIGIAELALAPCLFDSRNILSPFALKTVLEAEIAEVYPDAPQEQIDLYLQNTDAPAYFESTGFVSCGSDIPENPAFSESFLSMKNLRPFTPAEVQSLEVNFPD